MTILIDALKAIMRWHEEQAAMHEQEAANIDALENAGDSDLREADMHTVDAKQHRLSAHLIEHALDNPALVVERLSEKTA